MSLDMEYNQPSNSIISIGIVVGNLATGEILEEAEWIIHVDEQINPFITDLTGITQEQVDTGISLEDAYKQLTDIHSKHNCFRNSLCWGGGDQVDLRKALGRDDDAFLFGRRWVDAKTLFISYCWARDLKHQSGLARSLKRLGRDFEGTKHTAKDDAKNTFYIYRMLLGKIRE